MLSFGFYIFKCQLENSIFSRSPLQQDSLESLVLTQGCRHLGHGKQVGNVTEGTGSVWVTVTFIGLCSPRAQVMQSSGKQVLSSAPGNSPTSSSPADPTLQFQPGQASVVKPT